MCAFLGIVAITVGLIAINALYVAAEFATVSARRARIVQQAAERNRFARLLEPLMTDPKRLDHYVAACQLGITASSLLLGFYGQTAFDRSCLSKFRQLSGSCSAVRCGNSSADWSYKLIGRSR